ncbi:MAG TPA: hypothetical protein VLY23_02730 [Candidatus Acidoferrum sp.]|nr:hypothetical protein [Candidatus Acidoferrum sp.]
MLSHMEVLGRWAMRVAVGCALALALCGAASAQVLTCPVSSNLNVSATVTNVASTCFIDAGVQVTIASTGELYNFGPVSASGILVNNGTINNGGTLQNEPDQTITNFGTLLNNNYLDIAGGTLTNAGTLDNFGTIADTVTVGTLNNTGTLTNTGSMTLFDTVMNYAGANLNNTGTLSLSAYFVDSGTGADSFTSDGTLTNFVGGVVLAATDFTNDGSVVNRGTFYTGGVGTAQTTFTNNGTVTNYGTFSTSALGGFPPTVTNNGTFTNYGTFSNVPSGVFTATVKNNGTFDNFGTLTNQALFTNSVTGNLINETSATITIDGSRLGNLGLLTNEGTIILTNNGVEGELDNYGTLTNNGSIANNGGYLYVAWGATLSNTVGSSYMQTGGTTQVEGTINSVPAVQIQGGTLTGLGTINGNVNNSGGSVEGGDGLGGLLTVNGTYTQGGTGMLTVDLTTGSFYGVLDVSGLAVLDGTVDFDAIAGFTPEAGDDFTFLLFGSLSGEFAHIDFDGWACPTNDTCDVVYGANSVSLDIMGPNGGNGGGGGTTTPEPGGLWLLFAGLMAMTTLEVRRRSAKSTIA